MARVPKQTFSFNAVPGADFYLCYWAESAPPAWDYDNSNHSLIGGTEENGVVTFDLFDVLPHNLDGPVAIAIVAGEGDPADLANARLSDFSEDAFGTVDFTVPGKPQNPRFNQ